MFFIGGTKVGALFGEAVVFTKKNAPRQFVTLIKQHGALLAKGRLLGLQFDTLFTDGLYFEISRHAIQMAERLKKGLREKGCKFLIDSPTNQQFVVLDQDTIRRLEPVDENHTAVRFATSWATTPEMVDALLELL